MTTILVSGASGIVGYGILKSLRASGFDMTTIGTSIYDDSVAPAFCDLFELAPLTADPAYLTWLLRIIDVHAIDLIIPGIEADMYSWLDHKEEIEASGVTILQNAPVLTALCRDKWSFFEELVAANIDCAIDSSLDSDFSALQARFGTPFLLKPRRGFGSKGIVRVHDEESFRGYEDQIGEVLMAQPVVGDDDHEYSAAAFGDGAGHVSAVITLRRKLSPNGFTDRAEVVPSDEFSATIELLARHFRPVGPTNFQFRRTGAGLKLLEINPRISSSTSIRAAFGYNESAMAIDYFLNKIVPTQPHIARGRAVRYTEDFIFHDDRLHF